MRKRRLVKDVKEAEAKAAAERGPGRPPSKSKPLPTAEGKRPPGFQKGTDNPKYVNGSQSAEIKLPPDAFEEMAEQEKKYKSLVDRRCRDMKWNELKKMQIMGQVSRVVREQAILRSNAVRMTTEKLYRKRVQDPAGTESVFRYEAQAARQEEILFRMLGLDELHEAKVGQAEAKSKPAEIKLIVGGKLSKAHMAAGGGDDGEDE